MRRRIVTCLAQIAQRSTYEGQGKDHARNIIQRTLSAVSHSDTSLTHTRKSWSGFTTEKQLGLQRGSRLQSTEATWNSVLYPDSEMEIGCPAPDFEAPAVVNGEIKDIRLSDYKGKYVLLFFYPKDFTFVCPTEIIAFSDRAKEFEDLNCEVIAASTDTAEVHLAWIKTPRKRGGLGFMQIPILADVTKEISARFGVLKRDAGVALRGLYIINPEGIVEHATINNLGVGRSVDEALRTLQAIQYVAEHGEVCPAGWKPGDKAMVADPEKSLEYFESAPASQDEESNHGSALHVINSRKEFDSIIQDSKKVAVKFWAEWCGKCKLLAPHAEELALKYPGIKVASVQTTDEKLEGLVSDLGVKGLPAFRFFQHGKEVLKPIVGYKKQPLAEAFGELDKM